MRFDEQRSIYRDCRWCQGRGCLYCKAEADKAYRAEFPDGPKPIASFDLSDPAEVELAKKAIGAEAIRRAFGKSGGGVAEIIQNVEKARDRS